MTSRPIRRSPAARRLARPELPRPRGVVSEALTAGLVGRVRDLGPLPRFVVDDPLADGDIQLALHVLYGLHYDGFVEVDDRWEWEPSLLAWRATLEQAVRGALEQVVDVRDLPTSTPSLSDALRAVIDRGSGRSLSAYVAEGASLDQLRELLVHRSIYQRKEADGHTFAIPRLRGIPKAAMVRIQADEYGDGVARRSHAELFATTMEVLGLDPAPGCYLDLAPAPTLATDNLVSLFSLHRATMAELVGHLALFEMTSVVPMSRYAAGIRRLTGSDEAAAFYDVHVAVDEVHAEWAAEELAEGYARQHPGAAAGVVFGAAALMEVERRFSDHLLDSWAVGRSSLCDRRRRPRLAETA